MRILDPRVFIANVRDAVYEATPEILANASGRDGAAIVQRKLGLGEAK